jgi:hypothetical protein
MPERVGLLKAKGGWLRSQPQSPLGDGIAPDHRRSQCAAERRSCFSFLCVCRVSVVLTLCTAEGGVPQRGGAVSFLSASVASLWC